METGAWRPPLVPSVSLFWFFGQLARPLYGVINDVISIFKDRSTSDINGFVNS